MNENICIVTPSLNRAGVTPLSNFVKIFSNLANRVYVVSGGSAKGSKFGTNVQVMAIVHKVSSQAFMRIINYVHTQLEILCKTAAISRKVDLFVFSLGGEGLLASIFVLKLLRKKVILVPGGITTRVYSVKKDPLSRFVGILVNFSFSLVDKLILYSERLIKEADLGKYRHKILVAHRHFVDFSKFAINNEIDKRLDLVGYMGRLSKEKGILNLITAVPFVLKKRIETHFMIYGEGSLNDEIKNIIKVEELETHVKLASWVAHENVPQYLNELKMLVVPSYTEGLPNIILEAMACGTPVLATPVGAIPDIIKDGENGFLLNSNGSQHIADKIVESLRKPELLEKVSENAYRWVRENFSEEKTIKTWQKILTELGMPKDFSKA